MGTRPAPDLDATHVVATTSKLAARIRERFPEATLGATAERLAGIAEASAATAERIGRPNRFLRFVIGLLIVSIPLSIGYALWSVGVSVDVRSLSGLVSLFQATVESLIFIGAGIAFLVTLELRVKRARALRALHDLRAVAHLVDMHQLDKDPVYLLGKGDTTASSPRRTMTAFELNRYLDYCSELLSLTGKVAALYGQKLNDAVALGAVDQLESLTTSLSRKIWQKVTLLDRAMQQRPG